MRRHRNVKIVATLGPASTDQATIRALFDAGADVFRLNMSHGSHADHLARLQAIRAVEAETGRPIAVLADLQGPKLRVGVFGSGPVELETGQHFRFDLDAAPGDGARVQLPHPEIFAVLEVGSRLLVNDGKIRLRVEACGPDFADCVVTAGGTISDRKGVNVPDVVLPVAALSDKDRADLEFACEAGVDWLALSFVQRPEDVTEARELARGRAAILSKIEKPAAVHCFADILKVSDGIMVARGDLGVEMPVHAVPPIQKRLVRACRHAAKPVIVATQMLESMIESPMPTRAEVSDVATAIYEGADAVMLSAESAAGRFPVQAVQTMDAVARSVESDPVYREVIESSRGAGNRTTIADSIAVAAREIAETTDIAAICAFTQSGTTVRLAARERPRVPIIAMSSQLDVMRRMALVWGAHCVLTPPLNRFREAVVNSILAAREFEFADSTRNLIIIAGVPFNTAGSTNILRVSPCDERLIYRTDPD
ncbi:pyruvate kinase [Paracoccus sp. Z118]|uniref:pyruvate kinase n=1 Tax=Paracoccus sp. Z118 TaxID=2851017 RepID=UPI001C2C3315|nr:pyruvate kinase [Paracoccus sp. Z118]MBV0891340.1 pyruvate kinase [Paracoccus sp. Z118]